MMRDNSRKCSIDLNSKADIELDSLSPEGKKNPDSAFSQIPNEMIHRISQFLSPTEKVNMHYTCRLFKQVISITKNDELASVKNDLKDQIAMWQIPELCVVPFYYYSGFNKKPADHATLKLTEEIQKARSHKDLLWSIAEVRDGFKYTWEHLKFKNEDTYRGIINYYETLMGKVIQDMPVEEFRIFKEKVDRMFRSSFVCFLRDMVSKFEPNSKKSCTIS